MEMYKGTWLYSSQRHGFVLVCWANMNDAQGLCNNTVHGLQFLLSVLASKISYIVQRHKCSVVFTLSNNYSKSQPGSLHYLIR